jgi:hypothetical protein
LDAPHFWYRTDNGCGAGVQEFEFRVDLRHFEFLNRVSVFEFKRADLKNESKNHEISDQLTLAP